MCCHQQAEAAAAEASFQQLSYATDDFQELLQISSICNIWPWKNPGPLPSKRKTTCIRNAVNTPAILKAINFYCCKSAWERKNSGKHACIPLHFYTSLPLKLWISQALQIKFKLMSCLPKNLFCWPKATICLWSTIEISWCQSFQPKKRLKVAMSCSPTKEPFQVKESHQRKTTWSTSGQAHCKPPLFFG